MCEDINLQAEELLNICRWKSVFLAQWFESLICRVFIGYSVFQIFVNTFFILKKLEVLLSAFHSVSDTYCYCHWELPKSDIFNPKHA